MSGDKEKKNKGMSFRVSTKVEEAWYVKPDLLAGEGDEKDRVVIDADAPPEPDSTVTLGERDLESTESKLRVQDEDARHYQKVSLRGALLAQDDTGEREKHLASDDGSLSGPPPIPSAGPLSGLKGMNESLPVKLAALFEPGRVPPVWIAAIAFIAGMITTLIGVLIAL